MCKPWQAKKSCMAGILRTHVSCGHTHDKGILLTLQLRIDFQPDLTFPQDVIHVYEGGLGDEAFASQNS